METDPEKIEKLLKAPFAGDKISWRVGQAFMKTRSGKPLAKLLAYIDARDVMDRLDEVFGIDGWQDSYTKIGDGWVCSLEVRINGEWITKQDGAEETAVEAQKGGISDSFKRAAVKFGVGRFLYSLGETMVDLTTEKPNWPFGTHRDRETKETYYFKPPRVEILPGGKVSITQDRR